MPLRVNLQLQRTITDRIARRDRSGLEVIDIWLPIRELMPTNPVASNLLMIAAKPRVEFHGAKDVNNGPVKSLIHRGSRFSMPNGSRQDRGSRSRGDLLPFTSEGPCGKRFDVLSVPSTPSLRFRLSEIGNSSGTDEETPQE